MLIVACWGREPDAVAALFADPRNGKDWLKVYCDTYPIQGQLFRNGFSEQYSDGALIRLSDPDDGEPKWSVVTIVGNIDPLAGPDDNLLADAYGLTGHQRFLTHSRIAAAIELVGTKSFLAANEHVTRNVSTANKARMVAKGAWQGYLDGLDAGTKWMTRLGGMS